MFHSFHFYITLMTGGFFGGRADWLDYPVRSGTGSFYLTSSDKILYLETKSINKEQFSTFSKMEINSLWGTYRLGLCSVRNFFYLHSPYGPDRHSYCCHVITFIILVDHMDQAYKFSVVVFWSFYLKSYSLIVLIFPLQCITSIYEQLTVTLIVYMSYIFFFFFILSYFLYLARRDLFALIPL